MGYDIECIIDIHTYPGEYFCPVCRTLVFPNEAVQAQCTHLYCKPCLSHVANGTRACPYDGYLVTESDSKPLVESDKFLAENVGKVKVHCLFFRSGCTWQGTLSECNSHCSACSFGNSAVICNRCGVQIVHRQVHDHTQTCAGGCEAQQAAGGAVGTTDSSTTSTTTTTTAVMNPIIAQPAGPLPQAQNTQTVASTSVPGQNSNQQVNANAQTALVVPGAAPTPEQWYQQQYYQQYAGYQPYQQPAQQYYPPQQQPYQQYQQQSVPVQVQNQSNVHSQAAPQIQSQVQPQNQTHLVPQQPYFQPQAQWQGQPPLQQQMPHQARAQAQVSSQGQAQVHAPIQASYPNYQVSQQLPHPPMRPTQAQIAPQTVPPHPHGQVAPYAQSMGMQPTAQHAQVPQYHQPHASQVHIQPQMHYQQPLNQPPPPRPQPSNQPLVQVQQPAQSYHNQSQPYFHPPPPQTNQANVPAPLPQVPLPPVNGHHSNQQPQPQPTQMQAGLPHQHPGHPHASSSSFNPIPVHGQVPQQPLTMHQPPHGSLSQKQLSTMVPMQGQDLPAQNQQFPAHVQQPSHQFQNRPAMQPSKQTGPQQYAQQQPFHAPFQGHSHEQGHFLQPPMRPHRPYQTPQFQHPQNYMGRPMTPNPGMNLQTIQQTAGETGPVPHSGPVQLGSKQTSTDQNNAESTRLEQDTVEQAPVEKHLELVSVKKEVPVGQSETVENGGNAANDGLPSIKQEEVGLDRLLEQSCGGESSEVAMHDEKICKEENNLLKNLDNQDPMLSKVVAGGVSSTNSDKQSHIAASGSSIEANGLCPKSHASIPQRPESQFHVPGSREPGYFGPRPNNFESPSAKQGPLMNTSADLRGTVGRSPQPYRINDEPRFMGANGGTVPESSMFGIRDEKRKTSGREHLDPLLSHHPLVGSHSHMGNFGSGPEFGSHHMKHFGPRSADREYLGIAPRGFDGSSNLPRGNSFADVNGREAHGFGEGSRSFNPSSDFGNQFHNGRFPSSFEDHMAPRLLNNHNMSDEVFRLEGPGHLTRGDFGRGSFDGMRNSYSVSHAANFAGGGDPFDMSRNRRPMSTGWCRICRIDCETVEGLDRHSQTREHQNMAMDMVKMIKQQNKKRQRVTAGHISHGGEKVRKVGIQYHGNKP